MSLSGRSQCLTRPRPHVEDGMASRGSVRGRTTTTTNPVDDLCCMCSPDPKSVRGTGDAGEGGKAGRGQCRGY